MAEPPSRRAAKRLRDRRGDSLSALLELVIATGRMNAEAHILEQTVEVARGAELAQEVVGRLGHQTASRTKQARQAGSARRAWGTIVAGPIWPLTRPNHSLFFVNGARASLYGSTYS